MQDQFQDLITEKQKGHGKQLVTLANSIVNSGFIKTLDEQFVYIDINDRLTYEIFRYMLDFMDYKNIQIPSYFDAEGIGAHISLVYPSECISKGSLHKYLGKRVNFTFNAFDIIVTNDKIYYVLLVSSGYLNFIRKTLGLSTLALYKGLQVPIHSTVAVELRSR